MECMEDAPEIFSFGIRLRYGMLRVDMTGGEPMTKTLSYWLISELCS